MTNDIEYAVFDESFEVKRNLSSSEARAILQRKSEETLRLEVVIFGNRNDLPERRTPAMMSQMELDRRATERAEWLAMKTTWLSSMVGIGGVVVGALLTYFLTS